MDIGQNTVDDEGTGQDEAQEMLRALCDNDFDGDEDRAAQALGRPSSEIRKMLGGDLQIDDDLAMKIRGIANERDIEIDQ